MQKIHIFLPSYNEALNLPSLLQRIDQLAMQCPYWQFKVIVVNDGSKDDTLAVAQNTKINTPKQIVDLQPNRGLAGAMRAGFEAAIQELGDFDVVVALDADDSHNPLLIPRMIKQINEGSDVVIASRYQKGARIYGLEKYREYASWVAGLLFRVLKPIPGVKDYTCGFRAYKVEILKKALAKYQQNFIQEEGFSCMAEILIKISTLKPIIHELPMILRYDRKLGDSKMNFGSTVKKTLKLLTKKF
jgi:dolichol-phosphate mannosyltransferase